MNILQIKDFKESGFKLAFKTYFKELGIDLRDDTDVFDLITKSKDEENMICFGVVDEGKVLAFIMFQIEPMKSGFFKQDLGFIREFWVQEEKRRIGIGTKLLQYCSDQFKTLGVKKLILTCQENMIQFYKKQGFVLDLSYSANNEMLCVVKNI